MSLLELTIGRIESANIFAYCGNDPVSYVDPMGYIYVTIRNYWIYSIIDIYLSHSERKTLTTVQAITAAISAFIDGPVGLPLAVALGAILSIVWNYDDGSGVRIRYIWLGGYRIIIVGVYSR